MCQLKTGHKSQLARDKMADLRLDLLLHGFAILPNRKYLFRPGSLKHLQNPASDVYHASNRFAAATRLSASPASPLTALAVSSVLCAVSLLTEEIPSTF